MRRILLIVGGGIAAYKSCELIRLCRARAIDVRCVLTASGARFVSALTLSALSENLCDTSLWTLDESQMGHIRLSREADLVVVVPATADLLARMASGVADDLATTLLLATDKPVLAAPAMNVRMWEHPATRRNIARLRADGVTIIDPEAGPMACGEVGVGRLADITTIADAIDDALRLVRRGAVIASTSAPTHGAAATASIDRAAAAAPVSGSGLHVVVTAGPTREPIDPVRYLANRSSGRQGFAVAAAFAALGARVSLITGPVELATPDGVERVDVETACEMAAAVDAALPADAAILVAAVADWRVAASPQKIKKTGAPTTLTLIPNPDILATLGSDPRRPRLVIGFAAETERLVEHARAKLVAKRADWIVANDVSGDVMGGMSNEVQLITLDTTEAWERLPKEEVAARLAVRVVAALGSADAPAAASLSDAVRIAVKRLASAAGIDLPRYATAGAAGMDISAAEEALLVPGARAAIATGFALAIPPGFEVQVRPRSGLALRHGITCLNPPGTIDSDYRGEIKVILINLGSESVVIERGDRIAQLVVAPVVEAKLVEVDRLDDSDRGSGGFGSTGR